MPFPFQRLRCADRYLGLAPNRSLLWFGILDTPNAPYLASI